jgi:DNA ligase 1
MWDESIDPRGFWLSEKLDGVRCFWDGRQFLSRQGNKFFAPEWFVAGLPLEPLDGELWIGRKQFQRTVSIVRRHDGGDHWKEVRFLVFDAPAHDGPFEERINLVKLIMSMNNPPFAQAHEHELCLGNDHLEKMLADVEAQGGEGLMLRRPGSPYEAGRSSTLLKVKTFHDAEARIVGHEPGTGRHRGRLGALLVALANGTRFAVGTGLSDSERMNPPAIGSTITFKYQELTDAGVPRFPSYVGIRRDIQPSPLQGEPMSVKTATTRRLEFVQGTSRKFWQIEVRGSEVRVHFGRIGTSGQFVTKSFANEAAASKHAEKVTREKLAKGYTDASA